MSDVFAAVFVTYVTDHKCDAYVQRRNVGQFSMIIRIIQNLPFSVAHRIVATFLDKVLDKFVTTL